MLRGHNPDKAPEKVNIFAQSEMNMLVTKAVQDSPRRLAILKSILAMLPPYVLPKFVAPFIHSAKQEEALYLLLLEHYFAYLDLATLKTSLRTDDGAVPTNKAIFKHQLAVLKKDLTIECEDKYIMMVLAGRISDITASTLQADDKTRLYMLAASRGNQAVLFLLNDIRTTEAFILAVEYINLDGITFMLDKAAAKISEYIKDRLLNKAIQQPGKYQLDMLLRKYSAHFSEQALLSAFLLSYNTDMPFSETVGKSFLAHCPMPNKERFNDLKLLHAVRYSDTGCVKNLVANFDISDQVINESLVQAVFTGSLDLVNILLNHRGHRIQMATKMAACDAAILFNTPQIAATILTHLNRQVTPVADVANSFLVNAPVAQPHKKKYRAIGQRELNVVKDNEQCSRKRKRKRKYHKT